MTPLISFNLLMFKKPLGDSELWDLSNEKFLKCFSKDEDDEFFYIRNDEQKKLVYRIVDFGVDLAEDSWERGKKEGFTQGIFLGALVTVLFTFSLWVPYQAKQLKEYVMDCLEHKYSGYSADSARECVAEEFNNVFDI